MNKVAIIGGGAAGFFTAINLKELNPNLDITIYEGSNKLLAKVLISGGGRCNVTNSISDPKQLSLNYPRGHQLLKNVFDRFSSKDTVLWFKKHGVLLKAEEDGRMFPISNTSQTIYNCFVNTAKQLGISVKLNYRLKDLEKSDCGWNLHFTQDSTSANQLVFATGSNTQIWNLLSKKKVDITAIVPSLFTFTTKDNTFSELSGISVEEASIGIKGDNEVEKGALLITHKGFSGPAVLRLSAWKAYTLSNVNYQFTAEISWLDKHVLTLWKERFTTFVTERPKEKIIHLKEAPLPKRLWKFLVLRASIAEYSNWSEIGKKGITRLMEQLFNCQVDIMGKSTFKEEFVTAGGVNLDDVDPVSFESKRLKGIYFAGEILNIDAITGGFNFQAAWSVAFCVSNSIAHPSS